MVLFAVLTILAGGADRGPRLAAGGAGLAAREHGVAVLLLLVVCGLARVVDEPPDVAAGAVRRWTRRALAAGRAGRDVFDLVGVRRRTRSGSRWRRPGWSASRVVRAGARGGLSRSRVSASGYAPSQWLGPGAAGRRPRRARAGGGVGVRRSGFVRPSPAHTVAARLLCVPFPPNTRLTGAGARISPQPCHACTGRVLDERPLSTTRGVTANARIGAQPADSQLGSRRGDAGTSRGLTG